MKNLKNFFLFLFIFICLNFSPFAHGAMPGAYGSYSMTREASGTSWQPELTPMSGIHLMPDDWMIMIHGFASGVYDHQGGKRGDDQFFAPNMAMLMAEHPLGKGMWAFRSMLSLEPATISKNGYPLLLQTGETANGIDTLIDHQHPHDFLMELSTSYSLPLSDNSSVFAYVGYPGEPALGPATFMHRLSGVEIPTAPITHHWMDSTHVTFGVATLGAVWNNFKLDGSLFTGREPDQHRWGFDKARFDSYSARLTYNPTEAWSFQVSGGHFNSPEQLEPEVNQDRFTFSGSYFQKGSHHYWATTLGWGLNHNQPGNLLNAFLLESLYNINNHHNFIGRVEAVEKDELFAAPNTSAGKSFTVGKLSLGYIYDFPKFYRMRWGFGGLGSVDLLPSSLHQAYGDVPLSFLLWSRVKL